MKLSQSVRIAWRSIRSHKLRSTLTTLGVIIGIGAVITFVTMGAGLQAEILGDISPDDQQNVYVWAGPPDTANQGPLSDGEAQRVFTQADAEAVDQLEAVRAGYVYTPVPAQNISANGENRPIRSVIATGRDYLDPGDIADGERFEMGRPEVVLNPAMANQFEENVTVGDTVTITVTNAPPVSLTVVGITETSESNSPLEGLGPQPRVYLPNDLFLDQVRGEGGESGVRYIALIAEAPSKDAADIDRTKAAVAGYLESNESDASEFLGEDLVIIQRTSTELLSQLENVLDLLQNFVVGIAGISLLVGSIGIANIMLVSVTERTREIGIMKAVGAQNRDILVLFLVESVIIGAIGAVCGTLLGIGGGFALTEYIGTAYVFPATWAAIAIAVGVLVGILAGLYPAYNAAKTDPIDALRYE
jgi:putative ABC transport system permease protein